MTTDKGVRDMLSFLIARDTMHQNQWMAAIEELEMNQKAVVPSTFPQDLEKKEVSYSFMNFSQGEESKTGRWATGKVWMVKHNLTMLLNLKQWVRIQSLFLLRLIYMAPLLFLDNLCLQV